ncbi:MAG TPA: hypothetical protein ENI23_10670 [bacterium]|nr:hypothetical protein [bacterium]
MAHSSQHLLEESTKTAQEAAGVIGGTFEQGVGFTPNDNITSDSLNESPNLDFTQPDPTPDPDITGLNTELPETPQADKADDFVTRFGEIQGLLGGEEEFRQQQREETGVSGLRTTQEDLVSQIQGFQIQAKNLANQKALAGERIQAASEGRGRTIAGVAPLTASAQRKITLQQADIASQALTASATLNAVQGKLVTAQRLIEEAVQKKFGSLKAEKDAIIENLNVLMSSGTLTREENKRAEAQKLKQEAEKKEIEDKEAEKLEQWELVKSAIKTAGEQGVQLDAETLDGALGADTKEGTLSILSAAGAFVEEADARKEELELQKLEIELQTAGLKLTEAQRISNRVVGSLESLSDDQRSAYFKLLDKYENNSKDFFKVRDAFNRIVASSEDPSPAGDVAVVFNFMKMLDPGSVVRESEFALAASTGSLKEAMRNKFGKLATGEILEFTREDFTDRAEKLFDTALLQQQSLNDTFEDRAGKFGIPGGNVTREIDAVKRPTTVEGFDGGDLDEIDEILGLTSEGLFEEESLFNLFPDITR